MKSVLIVLLLATAAVAQVDPPEVPALPECVDEICPPCDPDDVEGCDASEQLPPLPGAPGVPVPQVDPPVSPPDLPPFRIPNGSAEPGAPAQEYEFRAWADGQYLRDLPAPGIDLIDLRVYEASFPDHGGGLVMRYEFSTYPGVYDAYEIKTMVAPDSGNASAIVLSSEDGMNWMSNAYLLNANAKQADAYVPSMDTPAGEVGVEGGMHHVVHVHASYGVLGLSPGMNATDWSTSAAAYSGEDRIELDMAPGGYVVAGAEAPEPDADGEFGNSSLSMTAPAPPAYWLAGAGRHLEVSGDWEGGQAVLRVKNPYSVAGQEIWMLAPSSASAQGAERALLAPGEERAFRYDAPLQAEAYILQWAVQSYPQGGWAAMEVELPAAPASSSSSGSSSGGATSGGRIVIERTDPVYDPPAVVMDPAPSPSGEDGEAKQKDSPLGIWVMLGVMAVAMLRRRRAP